MRKVDLLRGKLQKLVGLLTQKKIKVTQRGSEAYTLFDETGKPKTINIPQIPDNADDTLLAGIEGYVDHEVGHVLFSDFEPLKKSYRSTKLKQIMNMVEDSFIERKVAERFSGSSYNLAKTAELFERESVDPVIQGTADEETLTQALLCPAIRAWAGCHQFVRYMEDKWHLIPTVVSKIGDYAKRELPKIENSQQSLDVAKNILKLLDKKQKPKNEQKQQEDKTENKDNDNAKSQSKNDNTKSQSENDNVQNQQNNEKDSKDGDDGKQQNDSDDQKDNGQDIQWFDKSNGDDVFSNAVKDGIKKMIRSCEDGADYKVYTTDFDVIKAATVSNKITNKHIDDFESATRNVLGVVQKKLERAISAKSLGYWVGGHRSGKLNASSLSRFVVRNDDRIFKRKHVTNTKNTAVSLLIDCSGSMSGKRIAVACQTAYALIVAMERMGIKNEVLGFTTGESIERANVRDDDYDWEHSRRRVLTTYIFKSFSERFVHEHKARLTSFSKSMAGMYDNADGESVMIAANRLLARNEERKILIVLSDGQPNSWGSVDFDKHLKDTVEYIENKTPIDIVGIGIESDAVNNFYKNHVALNDVKELPTTCLDELQKILLK